MNLVKEWPSNLYNVQTIITATLDRLDRDRNNTVLLRALGELWVINSNELENITEMQSAFIFWYEKKPKHQERKKLKANNHYFSAQGRFHKFKLICAHQYPKYPHQMVTGAIPPLMTSHCRCSTLKFYFFLKIICILTCFDIDRFFSDVNLMTWNYWN